MRTTKSLLLATSLCCLLLLTVIFHSSLLFLSLLPTFPGQGAFTCNSRKPLYFPLTMCYGKWSRMDNGGSSSCQTGEQRTWVVPGMAICAITSGGPGDYWFLQMFSQPVPMPDERLYIISAAQLVAKSPALTEGPWSPKSYH